MEHLIIPEGYDPDLNLHDTQIAIKTVKDFFQDLLAKQLICFAYQHRCLLIRLPA